MDSSLTAELAETAEKRVVVWPYRTIVCKPLQYKKLGVLDGEKCGLAGFDAAWGAANACFLKYLGDPWRLATKRGQAGRRESGGHCEFCQIAGKA